MRQYREYCLAQQQNTAPAALRPALDYWRTLPTDADATFDHEVVLDAATLTPYVTWGTNPGQGVQLDGAVPDPEGFTVDDSLHAYVEELVNDLVQKIDMDALVERTDLGAVIASSCLPPAYRTAGSMTALACVSL